MSLLTRIKHGVARLLLKTAAFSVVPNWVTESILVPSFRMLTKEAYTKNSAFFACVSALTFGASEAPLIVLDMNELPLPVHPLRQLLRRPNPIMTWSEFETMIVGYMAIGGNAYAHKVRAKGTGRVIELWPYHAGQIVPVPGGPLWIKGFTYDDGSGTLQPIRREDIIHFKWPTPDPEQPWMALAPLRSAAAEVDADNEASRFLRALLKNDAVPRTVVSQSPGRFMNDDEVRRAKQQFKDRYSGDNRGDVLILEAGATVERLSLNLEEMAFEALHRIPEARICAVMRVPAIIAGLNVGLEKATYANYGEARTSFTLDTRVPLWNIVATELEADEDLNPGGLLYIRHDLSKVAALQEDQTNLWTRVINGYREGLMSDETAQGLLNLPRYSLPRMPRPAVTDVTPAPAALPEPEGDPEESAEKRVREHIDTKAAGTMGRSLQRIRADVAKRMEAGLDAYFSDLAERVIARTAKGWHPATERKAAELPRAESLLTIGDEKLLRDVVGDYYIEIIRLSWETWNIGLGMELLFGVDDPAVVEALGLVGDRIQGIQESTLTSIRQLLQHGAEQGWGIDELVRGADGTPGLRSLVEQTYKNRTRTIARTELGTAQNQATISRYETAGIAEVKILDGNGPNSCQTCTDLNGQKKDFAWARLNWLEHPNCIRAFVPAFDD